MCHRLQPCVQITAGDQEGSLEGRGTWTGGGREGETQYEMVSEKECGFHPSTTEKTAAITDSLNNKDTSNH